MMQQRARITLTSYNRKSLESVVFQIKNISKDTSVPLTDIDIILPQKAPIILKVDGEYQINYLDIHTCQMFLDADEMALRGLMRIAVPDGVNIEIILRN